jgi:NAD(P)-dependent dehydrogenase (short-subunit alcohol dehydrogenase family)
MKTIFITGASTGLGKATAILFQAKGWKVIATMRRPENETEFIAQVKTLKTC